MNRLSKTFFIWGVLLLLSPSPARPQSVDGVFAAELLSFSAMRSYYGGGDLEIHTIDVGQGASELIIGPNGTTILIDGGTAGQGSSEVLPYLNAIFPPGSRHLDYIIASHDDRDHYGGLNSVLSGGYTAGTIYHCGINSSFGKGIQIPLGLEINLGDGAKATCVGRYGEYIDGSSGNTSDNNASVCLLIQYCGTGAYCGFDYITAGDLEGNENQLSNALITYPPGSPYLDPAYGVDVIHVNHHGSDGSSGAAYVNRLKHQLAVINGGTNYGHPRWTAVDRLKGRAVYSDGSGATGVTWTGCTSVYRTTYDIEEDGRAPEWDCPTLGDMVLVYDGCSPVYYLNGTPFPIDQPPACTTPTATPPDYHTPTPSPSITPTPTPTPTAVPAGLPFYDGFETGGLEGYWTTFVDAEGRIRVSTSYPSTGSYSALLDDSCDNSICSIAALILTVDLSGYHSSEVTLEFWWREFGDENHSSDGVFISDDYGENWHRILSFNYGPESYIHESLSLSTLGSGCGVDFNDHFQIKFQFCDNYSIDMDGYAVDEVEIRAITPTPTPPLTATPTPMVTPTPTAVPPTTPMLTATPIPTVTPTATPPPPPTPCNAWVWLTDVTDITLGWIEYTSTSALGIGLVNSGPGEPSGPWWYGWIYDAQNAYSDVSEFYDHPRLWLQNDAGYEITIPEGYYFDVSHDSPDATSPLRIWLAQTTVPNGWEWYPSIGADGTVYTDTSNCTVWKAPVTPTPMVTPTPTATPPTTPTVTATPTPMVTPTPTAAPPTTPTVTATPTPMVTPTPTAAPPTTPTVTATPIPTVTPTETPPPPPTPCNAWVRLTDVTDITLGWIEYTTANALGIGLVNSGPGDPVYPSQRYGWIYDAEDVYGDGSEFYDHPRLWLWNDAGYPITIPEGYYFDVSHDSPDAANPLRIWMAQTTVPSGWEWYPSIGADGTVYTDTSNCTVWKAPVTPTPMVTPTPTATPPTTPTVTATPSPSPTQTSPATPSRTPSPPPTPTIIPTPQSPITIIDSGDYNGDGRSDIAIFRPAPLYSGGSSGMWAVRGVTRAYYGSSSDIPVSGDYDGDGTSDFGIFRGSSGLWGIRGVTRTYYGSASDIPIPGDYDGDGSCDVGIFRSSSGLWAINGVTRAYFGSSGDLPVPGDYEGDGSKDIALFRGSSGMWAIQGLPRVYYGSAGDMVVPGDYNGDGTWEVGIFRPSTGMWAIRGLTRAYYGSASDCPVPADYDGDLSDEIGIFRPGSGLWGVRGFSRAYFGAAGDLPVTR